MISLELSTFFWSSLILIKAVSFRELKPVGEAFEVGLSFRNFFRYRSVPRREFLTDKSEDERRRGSVPVHAGSSSKGHFWQNQHVVSWSRGLVISW